MIQDPAVIQSPSHPSPPVRDSSGPTLADIVVATLRASGVWRIYGLPGDSLNGLTDAIRRDGEMTWLHLRHEEAAAFAAASEAAVTGGPAVCAASCGPGNLHLINGLYDAHAAASRSSRRPPTSRCPKSQGITGDGRGEPRQARPMITRSRMYNSKRMEGKLSHGNAIGDNNHADTGFDRRGQDPAVA